MNKKNKGKISVIIPCYNQGEFLDDAVNSVLAQSYQNFEIIIVDDGSTDKYTQTLLKNYERPKTEVFHTNNNGAASARNYGFKLAKGEFIQFLDADDFIEKKKFEDQMIIFEKNPLVDICYTNYRFLIEANKTYMKPPARIELGKDPYKDFLYNWQRGLSIPIHSALFRAKVWNDAPPFLEGFGVAEDWIMWIKLAKKNYGFKFLDKVYAVYRVQNHSMTHNKSYVMYWVARAISYIAENLIVAEDSKNFDIKTEKYVDKLIKDIYMPQVAHDLKIATEKVLFTENSLSWKITWPLRKIERLNYLIKKQGFNVTMQNILVKIKKSLFR